MTNVYSHIEGLCKRSNPEDFFHLLVTIHLIPAVLLVTHFCFDLLLEFDFFSYLSNRLQPSSKRRTHLQPSTLRSGPRNPDVNNPIIHPIQAIFQILHVYQKLIRSRPDHQQIYNFLLFVIFIRVFSPSKYKINLRNPRGMERKHPK